jgi:hypothetical protein
MTHTGCQIFLLAIKKVLFVQMLFSINKTSTDLVLDIKDGTGPEVIMSNYHGGPNQMWEYKNGMIYNKLNR